MSVFLLDNKFGVNTIPTSGGLIAAGTRTCSGAGTLTFGTLNGFNAPAYTSGITNSRNLVLIFTGTSHNEGIGLTGPSQSVVASLGYKLDLLMMASSPPMSFLIGGVLICVFNNTYAGGMNFQGITTNGASPTFGIPGLGPANSMRIQITLYVRASLGSNVYTVEAWVQATEICPFPVCFHNSPFTLTSGAFQVQFQDSNLTNSGSNTIWTSDQVNILSIEGDSSGNLDPTAGNCGFISAFPVSSVNNANVQTAGDMLGTGYGSYSGTDLAIVNDILFDGAALSKVRCFTATNGQLPWNEVLFSGQTDLYGNTNQSLALFDETSANLMNAISLKRSPVTTSTNYSLGNLSNSSAGAYGGNGAGWTTSPWTASSPGTASAISIVVASGTGTLNVALCTYNSATLYPGNAGIAGLAPGSKIGSVTNPSAGTVSINIEAVTSTPFNIVQGQQYVIVIWWSGSIDVDFASTGGPGMSAMTSVNSTTITSSVCTYAYNAGGAGFAMDVSCPVTASSGFATATFSIGTNAVAYLTLADSGSSGIAAIDYTFTIGSTSTSISSLISTINSQSGVGSGSSGAWTAAFVSNNNSSSTSAKCPVSTGIAPTASGVNCNNQYGYLNLLQVPQNCALGINPNNGTALAVTQRQIDNQTQWLVGRFGTSPYAAANWGPEFIIGGGPLNGGTAKTGGDQKLYSNPRSVSSLADGRWAITCDLYNYYSSLVVTPSLIISGFSSGTTPYTNAQLQAGNTLEGYSNSNQTFGNTSSWIISTIAANLGASLGTETFVVQLPNGELVALGRNAPSSSYVYPDGCYGLSNGTLTGSGGSASVTWADPTDSSNTNYWCGCDGQPNTSDNVNVRPFLWSGNTPCCMVLDNSNPASPTLYVITTVIPETTSRQNITIQQILAANIEKANVSGNGGIFFKPNQYRVLICAGEYPAFAINNGVLCGVLGGHNAIAYFIRGTINLPDPGPSNVLYGVKSGSETGTLTLPHAISASVPYTPDRTQVLSTGEYGPIGSFTIGTGGSGPTVLELTLPSIAPGDSTWIIPLSPIASGSSSGIQNPLTVNYLRYDGRTLTYGTDYTWSVDSYTTPTKLTFTLLTVTTGNGDSLDARITATLTLNDAVITKVYHVGIGSGSEVSLNTRTVTWTQIDSVTGQPEAGVLVWASSSETDATQITGSVGVTDSSGVATFSAMIGQAYINRLKAGTSFATNPVPVTIGP